MAVNLSPLGGAGAQFFTNDGVPLSGGLLYTYGAGTTTPAATYTSSSGITALANPIVLDSAGRVPTGEIWLTDGVNYKFVLNDSTDALIATWDGLSGINSNFISYTAQEEVQTATAGQTVFTTTLTYIAGTNNLAVYINGSKQVVNVNYIETDDNTVTFLTGLNVGDVVVFSTATPVAPNATTALNVSYLPAGMGATLTNVQAKLRESVSVKDFGAKCDGTTDDTTAVQSAVNYCITNNTNLSVPGLCLLTASINIDRQVDGAAYDNYFIISGLNGGGFLVNTAIPMFSSTIAFTTAPVTQLTRFENLIFESSNSLLSAYVLNDARFLRVSFDGCSFDKIKLLTTSSGITQSIYLTGCNIRRFTGTFFNSGFYTYDFKFINCLVEAGDAAIRIKNAIGCAIIGSTIEGMSGTAIAYNGARSLDVTGCYFEANLLDIDGTDGGTSASVSYGICLNGNMFSHTSGASNPATYSILWGATFNGISIGNSHNSNMHNLTNAVAGVIVDDFATGSLCATAINQVQGGYDGTFTGTFTGFTATVTTTVHYNKVGNTVTLNFPSQSGTSNSVDFTITGLPTTLYPARQQNCVLHVLDNAVTQLGSCLVDTSGILYLGTGAGFSFTATGNKGMVLSTITYSLT